jgi:hypothetical protein
MGTPITAEDYLFYQENRRRLMLGTDLGRKCLLAGGVFWRLALEDGVDPSVVLRGPAPIINPEVVDLSGLQFHGEVFIDDCLSESDIAAVTGKLTCVAHSNSTQETARYFWPPQAVWELGGWDWIEWMPRNENQYRIKRATYADRSFSGAASVANWKHDIRGASMWKRMRTYHDRRAVEKLRQDSQLTAD